MADIRLDLTKNPNSTQQTVTLTLTADNDGGVTIGVGGATVGSTDIGTTETSPDAPVTGNSGAIFIAETDGVTLSAVTAGSGGSIEVTSGCAMTVAQTVTTAGSGVIRLEVTNRDFTVNNGATVASANGKIRLVADSGTLILENTGDAPRGYTWIPHA